MILRVRDENGNFIPINAIKGDSAYEQAVLGGYKGTEEEFIAFLNGLLNPVNVVIEDEDHCSDYNNPHKVTAEQVGSLTVYKSFEALNKALGTSFNPDTPIETIIAAMPDNTGLKADINTHGVWQSETTIYPAVYGILSIYKIRNNRVEVEYVSNAETGGTEYNKRWIGQYNAGAFGGFVEVYTKANKPTASEIGAVSKEGDTMTGNLHLRKENALITLGTDSNNRANIRFTPNARATDIINTKDGTDTTLSLTNEKDNDLRTLLRLWLSNGTCFNIFGEHNKPTGSYSGRSGQSEQKIQIGGMGNVLLITSSSGDLTFVTITGARSLWSNSNYFNASPASTANFTDGVLTVKDGTIGISVDGVTYYYQVL